MELYRSRHSRLCLNQWLKYEVLAQNMIIKNSWMNLSMCLIRIYNPNSVYLQSYLINLFLIFFIFYFLFCFIYILFNDSKKLIPNYKILNSILILLSSKHKVMFDFQKILKKRKKIVKKIIISYLILLYKIAKKIKIN